MRKLLLALIFATVSLGAAAQGPSGGPGPVPSPWIAQGSTVSPAQSTMGITIPSTVTGGNRGAGTLNATQLFQNGVQVNTSALPTGQVWIGNGDGTAAPQTLTGDVTLTTGGLVTITDLAGVTNGSLANSGLTNSSTTVNGQTCTLGSTCTITAAATGVSIGVTTIASGTSNGLLYNNAGVLGNLATLNNGVLVTNSSGVPSINTTLPSGLIGNISTLSTSSGPASGLRALGGRFTNPVDVRDYGAVCDGVTDDYIAFNDALFNNNWVLVPAGKTCAISNSISIANSERRLSGAGVGSSFIKNLTNNASAVIVAAGLSYVSIDNLMITHNVTATGGAGIGFAGNCGVCNISNVIVEKHYVGINASSTEQAYMSNVTVQENVINGLLVQGTASSGIVQWIVDGLLAQKNGGTGILIANGPAGPSSMILGSWNRIYTFANTGYGFAAVGSISMPINGVRISDSFLGEDGNSEIFLSTYGSLHTIYNTFLELTGTGPTGPTMSTPASGGGSGIEIDGNNGSVQIGSLRVNGVSQHAVNTAATAATTITNLQATNNGGDGLRATDCALVQISGGYFAGNSGTNITCSTNGTSLNAVGLAPNSLNNINVTATGSTTPISLQNRFSNPYDVRSFGAVCDGVTDDSAAFTAAAATGKGISIPADATCVVANVTFDSNSVLNCNGSTLTPPSSAAGKWIIKRTGAYQKLLSCTLQDPNSYTMVSTTLSGTASPGATTISVSSTTNLAVGMPIAITLNSGIRFVTRINAIGSGTVDILDPVPSSATAVAVAAGGTGSVTNDGLIVLGGTGLNAPLSIQATSSAGVVTGGTIQSPGLYTTPPSNPVSTQNTTSVRGAGATFNVTWAGASSGNTVQAAWGLLVNDEALEGTVQDLRIAYAPVGIVYRKSTLQSEGEQLSNFQINVTLLVGIFIDVNANTISINNGRIWGPYPSVGAVGIYMNGENPGPIATGGTNFVNVSVLQFDVGWLLKKAQLTMFTQAIADTNKYYGWVIDGSFDLGFDNVYAGATGPAVNDYGVGFHIGNGSINNAIAQLQAGRQASDFNVDSTSSVYLGQTSGVQSVGHKITGNGAGLFSGQQTLNANSGSISLSGTPIYVGVNGSNASEGNVAWRNVLYASTVTKIQIISNVAPGSDTWTATLRINVADTPMSCSYTGGATFGCTMTVNMQVVNPNDLLSVKMTSSGGGSGIVWATVRQQN